jgi:hypothetical protein
MAKKKEKANAFSFFYSVERFIGTGIFGPVWPL